MRSFATHTLFVSALAFGAQYAVAADADPLSVAVVQQQFINAKIVPDVIPSFTPIGILGAAFGTNTTSIQVGQPMAQTDVSKQPVVSLTGNFNSTPSYTVLMIDGNYVGSSNPNGLNLHWLSNNVEIGTNGAISNTTAATIPYAGPAPPSGTGPHRYTILFYQQPSNFTAPSSPAANSGVHEIDLATYVAAAGLTGPLAGLYYTVEVGTATVQVGSTTAVNPSTISVTASSTSGTTKASGTNSASPTSTSGAAVKLNSSAMGGVIGLLAGALAFLI